MSIQTRVREAKANESYALEPSETSERQTQEEVHRKLWKLIQKYYDAYNKKDERLIVKNDKLQKIEQIFRSKHENVRKLGLLTYVLMINHSIESYLVETGMPLLSGKIILTQMSYLKPEHKSTLLRQILHLKAEEESSSINNPRRGIAPLKRFDFSVIFSYCKLGTAHSSREFKLEHLKRFIAEEDYTVVPDPTETCFWINPRLRTMDQIGTYSTKEDLGVSIEPKVAFTSESSTYKFKGHTSFIPVSDKTINSTSFDRQETKDTKHHTTSVIDESKYNLQDSQQESRCYWQESTDSRDLDSSMNQRRPVRAVAKQSHGGAMPSISIPASSNHANKFYASSIDHSQDVSAVHTMQKGASPESNGYRGIYHRSIEMKMGSHSVEVQRKRPESPLARKLREISTSSQPKERKEGSYSLKTGQNTHDNRRGAQTEKSKEFSAPVRGVRTDYTRAPPLGVPGERSVSPTRVISNGAYRVVTSTQSPQGKQKLVATKPTPAILGYAASRPQVFAWNQK